MPDQGLKNREEIAKIDTWDVDALYPDFSAWNNELTAQKNSAPWLDMLSCQGKLHESVDLFKKALVAKLLLERNLEKLYTYAHLRHDENITDITAKTAFEKISYLLADFHKESAYFEPELLALPEATLQNYLSSPLLSSFATYLKKIVRMRPHTLSSDMERMLAMAAKPLRTSSKVFSVLNNAEIRFEKVKDSQKKELPLSHGLYQLYLRDPDRELRKNAFLEMQGEFASLENTFTELLAGQVERHQFIARARHFPSCLEAALFPHNVPSEVYHQLIRSVRAQLPVLHKYVALRKRVMGLKELHFYDLYVPLVEAVEFSIPYEEAEELVIASVAPLGEHYQSLLREGLQRLRWVDRYENKNKRSGAYSSGCYDSQPYILMNYRGTLRDLFTLAHEAGHSMHSLLSWKAQSYHDASYPIFVAEVASTFNEELLMHYMLKRAKSQKERCFLINEKIEDLRATLVRQTMFAEFELKIHEWVEKQEPLTPSFLKEIYLNLYRDYFGPELVLDEILATEWARIPHFYYNFYVYQYATGISAALYLAEKLLKGQPQSQKNYLHFLSQGGSSFPLDLLQAAGVDMRSSAPVDTAINTLDSLITELSNTL